MSTIELQNFIEIDDEESAAITGGGGVHQFMRDSPFGSGGRIAPIWFDPMYNPFNR